MTGIFISYRRADTGDLAGRIADRLKLQPQKPDVFLDFDSIPFGKDFLEKITTVLGKSEVSIVLIGAQWAGPTESGSRIAEAGDVVRTEIAQALKSGKKVLPVLVGGAEMPQADTMPEDIRRLTKLHAIEMRRNYFNRDIEILFDAIWGEKREKAGVSPFSRLVRGTMRGILGATATSALIFVCVVAYNAITGRSLDQLFGGRAELMIVVLLGIVLGGACLVVLWPRKRVAR